MQRAPMQHFGMQRSPMQRAAATGCAALLLAALGACETPAGGDAITPSYGEATARNLAAQQHLAGSAVLRNLSKDFRASTDDSVTFAFDSAALGPAARRVLDGQAEWLRAHRQVRMAIIGHTDLVGSERYNFGLGLRRAQNALDHLVARGVARDRLIAVESRGETEPLVPTATRERRNRRAVTMVAGFASGTTGFGLDGEYAARIYDAYQAGEIEVTEAQSDVVE